MICSTDPRQREGRLDRFPMLSVRQAHRKTRACASSYLRLSLPSLWCSFSFAAGDASPLALAPSKAAPPTDFRHCYLRRRSAFTSRRHRTGWWRSGARDGFIAADAFAGSKPFGTCWAATSAIALTVPGAGGAAELAGAYAGLVDRIAISIEGRRFTYQFQILRGMLQQEVVTTVHATPNLRFGRLPRSGEGGLDRLDSVSLSESISFCQPFPRTVRVSCDCWATHYAAYVATHHEGAESARTGDCMMGCDVMRRTIRIHRSGQACYGIA